MPDPSTRPDAARSPLFQWTSQAEYVLALVLEQHGPTRIEIGLERTQQEIDTLEVVAHRPDRDDAPGVLVVDARRRETLLDRAAGILADHPSPVEDPRGLARSLLEALGARPEALAP